MTDRELLETAAKAAGIKGKPFPGALALIVPWQENRPDGKGIVLNGRDLGWCWCPFDDEGDAMRLAVKMRITVAYQNPADLGGGYVTASFHKHQYRYLFPKETSFTEEFGCDPLHATLRTIVRAAAALAPR